MRLERKTKVNKIHDLLHLIFLKPKEFVTLSTSLKSLEVDLCEWSPHFGLLVSRYSSEDWVVDSTVESQRKFIKILVEFDFNKGEGRENFKDPVPPQPQLPPRKRKRFPTIGIESLRLKSFLNPSFLSFRFNNLYGI